MVLSFLEFEGNDPVSMAKEAAQSLTAARQAVEDKGLKTFLFHSDSVEEFDQRAEFSGVPEALDEIADEYLGSPDQRAKLTSALRREFEASKDKPSITDKMRAALPHPLPAGAEVADRASEDPDASDAARAAIPGGVPLGVAVTDRMNQRKKKSSSDDDDDESLGPCGCTDYHMADCPLRTGQSDAYDEPYDPDDETDWRAFSNKQCATGNHTVGEFRNMASLREAKQSGMCQGCQDAFFGPETPSQQGE